MKFGCCVDISKYKELVEVGYDFIELAGTSIYKMSETEFEQVKCLLNKSPIKCIGFNAFLSSDVKVLGDSIDRGRLDEYTDKVIYRAGILGIRTIGFGSPYSRIVPEGFSRGKAIEQVIDFVVSMSKKAEKYSINILVEPLTKIETNFINNTTEAINIIKDVNRQNVGLLLDLYHFCLEKEDAGIIDDRLMEHLRHVHIAEENGRTYLVESQFDKYKSLIDKLKLAGYKGSISIEASYLDFITDAVRSLEILKKIDS
ncbi:MAG: hypothetical protein K0R31_594 [Clostridiales bacterium]|jgi:sugar phosphate isomerase/epimerase|nr:hypothetical protein [Clostridiales bacterium]